MKLKDLLLEETAFIVLKKSITGKIMMVGLVDGKNGNKSTPFEDINIGLREKFLEALQEKYPKELDVEEYVKSQTNPVKFSMIGKRLRLVDDGKIHKTTRSLSDLDLSNKYRPGRLQ